MYVIIISMLLGGFAGYPIRYRYFKVPYFSVTDHFIWGLMWGFIAGVVILTGLSVIFTEDLQTKSESVYELREVSDSTYTNTVNGQVRFIRRVSGDFVVIESVSLNRSRFNSKGLNANKSPRVRVTSYEAIPNNWLISWDKLNEYTFVTPKNSGVSHASSLK